MTTAMIQTHSTKSRKNRMASDSEAEIKKIARHHGVTDEEYARIKKTLGRIPTPTEMGMYGVMYSEHCSYKSSKSLLKLFPTEGPRVLVPAGEENAGVVDIGDGLAVAFKIESHNHPSAVEPFQGAATGVGGILRDIFTMGARPIALMDSLRCGNLGKPNVQRLFKGVVSGIAFYGNCIGFPTIGGEIAFDETYEGNPLVNVFCLGILEKKNLVKGCAKGAGNPVFYLGAATGRDGLGGASFASRELTESSHEDRPSVQVADPFLEKLLLEACLELIQSGVVVGIQDMGAAGLTCSTCETAARGGVGMEIDIAKVPRREKGLAPYEVMLSESQERMLVIIQKGKEKVAERIFRKWDLHAVKVGRVTSDGMLRIYEGDTLQAEMPAKSLTDEAPVYERPAKIPEALKKAKPLTLSEIPEPPLEEAFRKLLGSPTLANKQWVYEQYDHMVQTNTVVLPGRGTSVIRIKGTKKFVALTTDGNGTYVALDPYHGGIIAVCEAARNLVTAGAEPVGLSDCLNFGSPEDPEVFWQFKECVRGMAEACRALSIPVTGGNVSFYNESPKGSIDPTPVVAMVGLIENTTPVTGAFKDEGDAVILLGETKEEIGGSEYLKVIHRLKKGPPPEMDLERERRLHAFLLREIREGCLQSAHDLSEGGFAVAVAECCMMNPEKTRGVVLDTKHFPSMRRDAFLFGETQSRVLVSVKEGERELFFRRAKEADIPAVLVGRVKGRRIQIGEWVDITVEEAERIWRGSLHGFLGR